MSKIPYFFETPVPRYFRDNGWFKNPTTRLFIMWSFERCSPDEREVLYDHTKIRLKPYQFIFGRKVCSDELRITEGEVRNQVNNLVKAGFLKNATNSTTKRYSVYEWVTEAFSKSNNQVNSQVTTKWQPSNNHNQDIKNKRNKKKNHHPKVSSSDKILNLTDDLFFDSEDKEQTSFFEEIESLSNEMSIEEVIKAKLEQHQVREHQKLEQHQIAEKHKPVTKKIKNDKAKHDEIEIYPHIFMSQTVLDKCIAIKGSRENVERAVEAIMRSPGRKREIYDWPNTMLTWKIKPNLVTHFEENEKIAKNICKIHACHSTFPCSITSSLEKDIKYFSIQPATSEGHIHIALSDPEFKPKVRKALQDRKMPLGLLQNADRVSLISV